MKIKPKQYLEILKAKGIQPNWWCSEEYFEKAGFVVDWDLGNIRVFDSNRQQLFPSISQSPFKEIGIEQIWGSNPNGFWADFAGYYDEYDGKEFLDFEYLYWPIDFLNMKGKDWAVFRKNSRKFIKRMVPDVTDFFLKESGHYSYRVVTDSDKKEIDRVLLIWAENLNCDQIEDAKVMFDFVLWGNNRKGLFGPKNELYGLNVWDENYQFINFRYSICDNYPFLAEYMRLLFYLEFANSSKLVNDGGTLGRESLADFKNKMNPIAIRKVYGKKEKV